MAAAPSVEASVLKIEFTGLDLVYFGDAIGGELCDATTCDGGFGDPSEADPLSSMTFSVDGNPVGTLTTNIFADLDMLFDAGLRADGTLATGTGGFLDLLMPDIGTGLVLNADLTGIVWDSATSTLVAFGTVWALLDQGLPFDLAIGMPITFAFQTNGTPQFDTSGTYITSLSSTGSGDVIGETTVPEPASILLLGMGLLAAGRAFRRTSASR